LADDVERATPAASGRRATHSLAKAALDRAKATARQKGYRPKASNAPAERSNLPESSGDWSGPRSDNRDPEPIGRTVSHFIGDQDWQQQISVASLTARWTEIVGTSVARHTQPIKFEHQDLLVQASSTAWATQLRIMTPNILSRIADEIGPGIVQEVKIVGPNNRSFKRGPKSVPGRGARDTWG